MDRTGNGIFGHDHEFRFEHHDRYAVMICGDIEDRGAVIGYPGDGGSSTGTGEQAVKECRPAGHLGFSESLSIN